jgi:hypothetical protein
VRQQAAGAARVRVRDRDDVTVPSASPSGTLERRREQAGRARWLEDAGEADFDE